MESYHLPDADHVEQSFNALRDTIAGNEGLTSSQVYMFAVLEANGLSHAERVRGCEGFFEAIGNGAKKVWEYIQKFCKMVKDFFFGGSGSKASKAIDDADKKVEDNKKELGQKWDESKVDAIWKQQVYLKGKYSRYVNRTNSHIEADTGLDGKETPLSKALSGLRKDFEAAVKESDPIYKEITDGKIENNRQAKVVHTKLVDLLKCLRNDEEMVKKHQTLYEQTLSDLEKKVESTADFADKMDLQREFNFMKTATKYFVNIGKYITETTSSIKSFSDIIKSTTNK